MMLAMPWTEDMVLDLKDWWVSEKLDGVRAIYHPDKDCLISRKNKPLHAPRSWLEKLRKYNSFLDGELVIPGLGFQQVVSIVRNEKMDELEWDSVRYKVFDVPHPDAFAERDRWAGIKDWKYHVDLTGIGVEFLQYDNMEQVLAKLQETVDRGGEGLMLRHKHTTWWPRRTDRLLKMKPLRKGTCLVVERVPGIRRGNVKVSFGGVEFSVGTGLTDEEFATIKPGDLREIGWRDYTDDGVPISARFL